LMKLDRVFQIFSDRDEASAAFVLGPA